MSLGKVRLRVKKITQMTFLYGVMASAHADDLLTGNAMSITSLSSAFSGLTSGLSTGTKLVALAVGLIMLIAGGMNLLEIFNEAKKTGSWGKFLGMLIALVIVGAITLTLAVTAYSDADDIKELAN